jgi:hypothetical protein
LLSRVQQPHPHGDDRERITRACQSAEALFTPKRQITEPSASKSPPADQSARKPRVLRIISSPAAARHEAVESPISREQPMTLDIPASEFARIRTWIKYGMTVSQIAEVYGAAVADVERILRQA